jgi:hypothetical protein
MIKNIAMIDKGSLDEEVLREIASVGGGYGSRLEDLMDDLRRLRRAILYLKGRLRRQGGIPLYSMRLLVRLRKDFLRKRREALEVRRYLIVYREALGLIRHKEVFELYNIEGIEI